MKKNRANLPRSILCIRAELGKLNTLCFHLAYYYWSSFPIFFNLVNLGWKKKCNNRTSDSEIFKSSIFKLSLLKVILHFPVHYDVVFIEYLQLYPLSPPFFFIFSDKVANRDSANEDLFCCFSVSALTNMDLDNEYLIVCARWIWFRKELYSFTGYHCTFLSM